MLAHFIKRSPWVVDSKFRRRSPRATASNLQRECNSKQAACLLIATVISAATQCQTRVCLRQGGAGGPPIPGVWARGGRSLSPRAKAFRGNECLLFPAWPAGGGKRPPPPCRGGP